MFAAPPLLKKRGVRKNFEKKWWAKRWGARTSRSQKLGIGRHLSDKLSQIPSEILRSAEFQRALLELGDEELTNITKSYISSNQKRSDAAHRRKIELDLSRSIRSNNTDNITNNSCGNALRSLVVSDTIGEEAATAGETAMHSQ